MNESTRNVRTLAVEPLSAGAFEPFGDVIAAPEHAGRRVNDGMAERFDDIAHLELTAEAGRPTLSWFRVQPVRLPALCTRIERHPLSSQTFMPLRPCRFLVVVAPPAPAPEARETRAFLVAPGQTINYRPAVWHHPVLALDEVTDFLMLGRVGPDADFELAGFAGGTVMRIDRLPG